MKIDKIKIENFRGATNPLEITFNDRPISLIFGENGTGKSTIIDAIDFICNQKLGSLETMSLGSKVRTYTPSIGTTPEMVRVEIQSGSNTWQGVFSGKDILIKPRETCPQAYIIRRDEITSLITAQPSERYKVLQKFVDVPLADYNENELKKALDQKKKELDAYSVRKEQARDVLQRFYMTENHKEGDYIKWAKDKSITDISALNLFVTQVDQIQRCYDKLSQDFEQYFEGKNEVEVKEAVLQEAHSNLCCLLERTASQSVELLEVLTSAQKYISKKEDMDSCPVCEQSVTNDDLKQSLSTRVNEMQELKHAVEAKKYAEESRDKAQILFLRHWKTLIQESQKLVDSVQSCSGEPASSTKIVINEHNIAFIDDAFNPELETQITSMYRNLTPELRELFLHKTDSQKLIDQHKLITVNVQTYVDCEREGGFIDLLCRKLDRAYQIHASMRKLEIEGLLASLTNDIDSLYSMIHPNEKLGSISLFLKPNVRASLELEAIFENTQNIPPHAYYSESHIDTLGICVFLALAKYNNADVIVLDDVLTSVDSQHLARFIEMLSYVTQHFQQIIVTTHYRPWQERYRKGRGQLSNTQVIELGPWTLANGIRTRDFATELDLLKNELQKDNIDRQVIASKGGVILESILDFLTLTYHLKVRRNHRHEYSIGELADSFDIKISQELKTVQHVDDKEPKVSLLAPLIKAATSFPWVRNCVGCHNNEIGEETPDGEVREFGEAVVTLADTILCPTCSSVPRKKVEGNHWECMCQNGTFVMHPLEHP